MRGCKACRDLRLRFAFGIGSCPPFALCALRQHRASLSFCILQQRQAVLASPSALRSGTEVCSPFCTVHFAIAPNSAPLLHFCSSAKLRSPFCVSHPAVASFPAHLSHSAVAPNFAPLLHSVAAPKCPPNAKKKAFCRRFALHPIELEEKSACRSAERDAKKANFLLPVAFPPLLVAAMRCVPSPPLLGEENGGGGGRY